MRIKKTSQYIEGGANLSNVYGTSNSDGYTQEYINEKIDNDYVDISSSIVINTSFTDYSHIEIVIAKAKKTGNLTTLNLILRKQVNQGTFPTGGSPTYMLTLPEAYRPTTEIISICGLSTDNNYPTWDGSNSGRNVGWIKIETNGHFYMRYNTNISSSLASVIQLQITY